jgi:hypothetical protein
MKYREYTFEIADSECLPRRIHNSTILFLEEVDACGDLYWVWVTAANRKNAKLLLRAYLGTSREREMFSEKVVGSWCETRHWINSLPQERVHVDGHCSEDFERIRPAFKTLVPQWFELGMDSCSCEDHL